MSGPLEKWRLFLRPRQRAPVERDYSGPTRVLGGAGTGKTVAAMHRAKFLAGRLGKGERLLLLTAFTRPLADDIRDNLKK
ncbi:MAG: AAA family ATPase, partial [Deltaproteobacteria bacterium]|nr:AAA family ATPase [Deltaproteobacteria bacterium]